MKFPVWIVTTTTISFFLCQAAAVAALVLDSGALPLSYTSTLRRGGCLRNGGPPRYQGPARISLTQRFSTVAPDSVNRPPSSRNEMDSTSRGFNNDDHNVNDVSKIHLMRDESRSSFWSTSIQPNQAGDYDSSGERILPLPNVPTLDFDGPLPRGAYRMLGNPAFEPKPTCLLTVAVDVQPRDDKDYDEMNPHVIVKRMQRLVDAGLTTFSLRLPDVDPTTATTTNDWCQDWAEENVYGRLLRDTPSTALAQTQLIVPMTLPTTPPPPASIKKAAKKEDDDSHIPVTATTIRKTVLGSLQRMGADCIDTLQLQYVNTSPYHLDVLDYLMELQREGLIRSITGRNLPAKFLEQAHRCGFHVDNNQLDGGSLLMPLGESDENDSNNMAAMMRRRHRPSIVESMSKTGTRLVLASPLAGGLLTERHFGKRTEPKPWEFASESERLQYVSTSVPRWFRQRQTLLSTRTNNGRKKETNRWSTYQKQLLEPLQEIAWKHCVSIAAVSLRFVLQNQQYQQLQHQRRDDYPDDPFSLASVVVANRLGATCQNDDNRWERPQQLRQVFRFALDEEDMERLREIAYQHHNPDNDSEETMHQKMILDSWEQEYDEREMNRLEEEHMLLNQPPDITNRRLWL